jgi:small multidrug resistance family-3 protein
VKSAAVLHSGRGCEAARAPCGRFRGTLTLILFAIVLARVDASNAGRAYASYGGIYIISSILWLRAVEGVRPDRSDLIGMTVALAGAGIILWGPRAT